MFGHVIPISCRKNVTMLLTETSFGSCTPTRRGRRVSQLRNPLSRCVPKLSKNCPKPSRRPLSRLLANFKRVVGDVLDDLLDLGDDRPERRRRDAQQVEQPFDDELDRIVDEPLDRVDDPADQAAGLLAQFGDLGADLVDRRARALHESLLKLSRVAIALSCSWSSCPSNFGLAPVAAHVERLRQVGEDLGDAVAGVLDERSHARSPC